MINKIPINNISNNRETSKPNTIFNTGLTATKDNRYCTACHIKLVNNPTNRPQDKYIYMCPQCGVTLNIYNTEPKERLITTFPTTDPTRGFNSNKLVHQSDRDRLSRSQYFIQKNMMKRSEIEDDDPYLKILKQNNKIRITSIDYNDPTE
jgi:hypothetical protein